jgi:glycopeptide antibiotics resistance protein
VPRIKLFNILFLCSLLFIVYLTIFPNSYLGIGTKDGGGTNFVPFHTMKDLLYHHPFNEFIMNNVGNIVLFVPFGLFLSLKFNKTGSLNKVILSGMLLSVIIECIQIFIPNRWTDIDDVILNTIGTGIGYYLLKLLKVKKYKCKN